MGNGMNRDITFRATPKMPTGHPASWVRSTASPGQPRTLCPPHHTLSLQKEERTMLEDIWVTLSELDNVTFSFKQLDENSVASE